MQSDITAAQLHRDEAPEDRMLPHPGRLRRLSTDRYCRHKTLLVKVWVRTAQAQPRLFADS